MIKRFAHKLKGSALNMEFVQLGDLALRIEKKSDSIKDVQELLEQIKQEWTILSALIV